MNMRSYGLVIVVLLAGCGAPGGEGTSEGPPGFMPSYPGSKTMTSDVYYQDPGCEGRGYIADDGGEFTYASVRTADGCSAETGAGYGYQASD